MDRSGIIEIFIEAGVALPLMCFSLKGEVLIEKACRENGWFTVKDIYRATRAITGKMLERGKLTEWAGRYKWADEPRKVAVIMAGNIPFAGFFDLLCVLVSGHECHVKYSSKDRVLMEYVTGLLRGLCPHIPLYEYDGTQVDAVIASGSNSTVRELRTRFESIPSVFRGHRSSAAILDGSETAEDLEALSKDIFSYSGLGCRNVSHLLIPHDYDPRRLADIGNKRVFNPKYINNYLQRQALLELSGEEFIDCGSWILRRDTEFPAFLSEVTYGFYRDRDEAANWVSDRRDELQCIVAREEWSPLLPFSPTGFGTAQSPALDDYPDRIDTMQFLQNL